MRNFVLFGLLAGVALTSGGCLESTAYSPTERNALIARTWRVDSRQAVDDIDSALLLRPPSRMTIWHIR